MPEYRREGGPWRFTWTWRALRRELEVLAAKGEDCAAFSVRSERGKGDEADARDHAATRDLFGLPPVPQANEKGLRTAPSAPVGHPRSQERELSEGEGREREEREEHERKKREERERKERAEREQKERAEHERKEREERERKAREERERKERAERERKERAERERNEEEQRARREKEERERKEREDRERGSTLDQPPRRQDRKTTAPARSTRSRLKAGSSGAVQARTQQKQHDRRLPVWCIAAGAVAIALVGLVLLLRGSENDGSSGGDPAPPAGGTETVEETLGEAASPDGEDEDTESLSNPAEPRLDPGSETADDRALPQEETSISAAEADTRTPTDVGDDPECVDWNSLEYWRFATYETAKACFDAGADVRVRGTDGGTPLHYVIQVGGELAVLELLLAAGADVNALLDDGSTPLHLAAEFTEQREVVAALVRSGADPNGRNTERFNFTPLHYAAQFSQHPEVIEALLDLGADPGAESSGGLTPWDLASDREELLASEAFRRLAPSGRR